MIHDPNCECDAYACRLRRKGLQVSTAALPSQHNRRPTRRNTGQAWNAQLVYQDRPGGFKMPIYDPETGSQRRIKQYTEQRHKIDSQLARIQAGQPS
jgi:hypothetical protein